VLDTFKPVVWEYSRLNITNTVMSKRKLNRLVTDGHVNVSWGCVGWGWLVFKGSFGQLEDAVLQEREESLKKSDKSCAAGAILQTPPPNPNPPINRTTTRAGMTRAC